MAERAEGMVILTGIEDNTDVNLYATTTSNTGVLVITENSEDRIYEAAIGDETVAGVVYSKVGNRVTLMATSVFPAFRGKGVAARLLSGVLETLQLQGATVTITCPFAAAFVSAHPEYADVLDTHPSKRGTS
jgi:predicted GNAT family acetyltransferase